MGPKNGLQCPPGVLPLQLRLFNLKYKSLPYCPSSPGICPYVLAIFFCGRSRFHCPPTVHFAKMRSAMFEQLDENKLSPRKTD